MVHQTSDNIEQFETTIPACEPEQGSRREPLLNPLKAISDFITGIFKFAGRKNRERSEAGAERSEEGGKMVREIPKITESMEQVRVRMNKKIESSMVLLREGLRAQTEELHDKRMRDIHEINVMLGRHAEATLEILTCREKFEEIEEKLPLAHVKKQILLQINRELKDMNAELETALLEERERVAMCERTMMLRKESNAGIGD